VQVSGGALQRGSCPVRALGCARRCAVGTHAKRSVELDADAESNRLRSSSTPAGSIRVACGAILAEPGPWAVGILLLGGAGVARNLPRLGRQVEGSRIRLAAGAVRWSRPGGEVVLTRVIAYLQLAGAGLAAVLLTVSSVGEVDRRGTIVCMHAGAVFAAGLLRAPARIRSRWLTAIALIGTTLFGGF